jgi:hypothetical protein
MEYPAAQAARILHAWRRLIPAGPHRSTDRPDTDLARYIALERAQSVFPDVIRAALAYRSRSLHDGGSAMERSVRMISRALRRAREPLMDEHGGVFLGLGVDPHAFADPLRLGFELPEDVIAKALLNWRGRS